MEERKKLYFIYNPHSGREQIRTKLYHILQIFSDAGYDLAVCPTREKKDAVRRIELLPDDYDLVVCSGGDGTIDEVVQGMMRREVKIPIGYIPSGTVNDFARSLKIPRDMLKAARLAVEGTDFPCDMGTFNKEHFVYIAAFGIFTDVAYSTNQNIKNVLGHMAYLLEGMKRLTNVPSCHMRICSRERYVEELEWLEEEEMLDVTAITQSAPGPLPVNASVIIGYRMAGIVGALTAILGTILPPMVIISVISVFYEQFRTNPYIATALEVMRAGVAAVIFDVVINLAGNVVKTKRILYIAMMVIAFVATYLLDVSAMIIIFVCLGIGLIDLFFTLRTKNRKG